MNGMNVCPQPLAAERGISRMLHKSSPFQQLYYLLYGGYPAPVIVTG